MSFIEAENIGAVTTEEGNLYLVPKDGGESTELEMMEFLYGIVRYLKPMLVVETGTFLGYGTRALGMACMCNSVGRVISCDINPDFVKQAQLKMDQLPVEIRTADSLTLPELRTADLVFSDSAYNRRIKEYDLVKPGCVFIVHDTKLVPELTEFTKDVGGMLFARGRGFGIIQKG